MKIKVGLYGTNGHQVQRLLERHDKAQLAATAAFDKEKLSPAQRDDKNIRQYEKLEELLADKEIQLVSLCSPLRRNQAQEALLCMRAGKHVYAEKPCAMTEKELDALMETAAATGCSFREMAGTAFAQPYLLMRELVAQGAVGTVVQVFGQKSYPLHAGRPQDEDVDGGLICQCGVHALRFVEHVAQQRVESISAIETSLGNPVPAGGLQIAASMLMTLENGAVASIIANYLNPKEFGRWGNEHLRIFGTDGFIETVNGENRVRLVRKDADIQEIVPPPVEQGYFDLYIHTLLGTGKMPVSLEEELRPTRLVIRAKESAKNHGRRM